jgi:hypothetical protein
MRAATANQRSDSSAALANDARCVGKQALRLVALAEACVGAAELARDDRQVNVVLAGEQRAEDLKAALEERNALGVAIEEPE